MSRQKRFCKTQFYVIISKEVGKMINFESETKQNIRSCYDEMTPVEKNIAEFFLNNTEKCDLSSKNIAKLLYVSEASLSRFAKKCGYKGYRELTFSY